MKGGSVCGARQPDRSCSSLKGSKVQTNPDNDKGAYDNDSRAFEIV